MTRSLKEKVTCASSVLNEVWSTSNGSVFPSSPQMRYLIRRAHGLTTVMYGYNTIEKPGDETPIKRSVRTTEIPTGKLWDTPLEAVCLNSSTLTTNQCSLLGDSVLWK